MDIELCTNSRKPSKCKAELYLPPEREQRVLFTLPIQLTQYYVYVASQYPGVTGSKAGRREPVGWCQCHTRPRLGPPSSITTDTRELHQHPTCLLGLLPKTFSAAAWLACFLPPKWEQGKKTKTMSQSHSEKSRHRQRLEYSHISTIQKTLLFHR